MAAQAAALEALKYQDDVDRRVEQTLALRVGLEDGLRELGLWVAESDANFVWVRLPQDTDEAAPLRGCAIVGCSCAPGTHSGAREG